MVLRGAPASAAAVCRQTSRALTRHVAAGKAPIRDFSSGRSRLAASNFVMPAMSPTMTEGNIASWKVKEGDSFSTGDVLLEIETDKAQMDVEAQDDGVMAKITQQDGSKGVKVGTRIAVLADTDDDLSSLEIPPEDNASVSQTSQTSSSSKKSDSSSSSATNKSSSSTSESTEQESASDDTRSKEQPQSPDQKSGTKSSSKYPLYPSVEHLLHTKGIESSEVDKIPASGPGGRLLKGDVLAYIGAIEKSYSAEQSKRISKLGHLDLSNAKPAKRADAPAAAKEEEKKKAATAKEEAPVVRVTLPVSLAAVFATQRRIQESMGLNLPVATFVARASEIANEALPPSRAQRQSPNALFNAVLGAGGAKATVAATRGHFTPLVTAPQSKRAIAGGEQPATPGKPLDIIDVLSGKRPGRAAFGVVTPSTAGLDARRMARAFGAGGAENVFAVDAPRGDERRARIYLERVKTVLEAEPGRCVL